MAYFLQANSVEPEKKPYLGNGCVTRKNGVTLGGGVFCAARAEAIWRGPAAITSPQYRDSN
jgi:hypothetical protein